jgi:phosphoribosylaminoimidazolecarboxamide formyltransferase/IMP cyclohydrolase
MPKDTNKYALLSVYDKTDIASIADALVKTGHLIIATAGTGAVLEKNGISYILASTMTGNPEALTDCLQTLSFKFAGGIIYNRHNKKHQLEVKDENIPRIDVVVCNLTNISETVKTIDDFNIQHVDLGGPTMVRAACINYKDVLVVTDPNDYQLVSDTLLEGNNNTEFRKQMAIKGFRDTSNYDEILVQYLTDSLGL